MLATAVGSPGASGELAAVSSIQVENVVYAPTNAAAGQQGDGVAQGETGDEAQQHRAGDVDCQCSGTGTSGALRRATARSTMKRATESSPPMTMTPAPDQRAHRCLGSSRVGTHRKLTLRTRAVVAYTAAPAITLTIRYVAAANA